MDFSVGNNKYFWVLTAVIFFIIGGFNLANAGQYFYEMMFFGANLSLLWLKEMI